MTECKHDRLRRVDWKWGRWECIDCGQWVDDPAAR